MSDSVHTADEGAGLQAGSSSKGTASASKTSTKRRHADQSVSVPSHKRRCMRKRSKERKPTRLQRKISQDAKAVSMRMRERKPTRMQSQWKTRRSEDSDSSSSEADGILETKSTFWVESIVEEMWEFEPSARRTRPKWVRQYEIMWKKSRKNSSTRVVTEVVDMEKKNGWPAAIAKWRAQWNKRSPMQQPWRESSLQRTIERPTSSTSNCNERTRHLFR